MSRRVLRATAIVAGIVAVWPLLAGATCPSGCSPTRKSNFQSASTFAFGSTFSSTDQNTIFQGADYWNNYFFSLGYPAPFQFTSNAGSASVVIRVDPSLSGTGTGAVYTHGVSDGSGTIRVNPDYLGNSGMVDIFRDIFEHEFGHGLGFDDVTQSSCNGFTAMFTATNGGTVQPVGPSMTDCDNDAAVANWPPPPPPPSEPQNQLPPNAWGSGCNTGLNCDPLVFDLNGDGVRTTGLDDPVSFDVDGDGAVETIGWTNPDSEEGFLWLDLDRDHEPRDGSELFGIGTKLPTGGYAKDGFEALASYDQPARGGNGDGLIDASDGVWKHLRLWIDRNHNGVCDPGESVPLARYQIVEIRLSSLAQSLTDAAGNIHQRTGTYVRRGPDGAKLNLLRVDSIAFRRR